ncbi:zinc finger CCCH domain-containing protein 13 isoform X2 [Andrographis paniculata]|nr:zinc finger CCCH domain-containing protein 13 isoform X2 [Andrographis paniculata]XP_051151976.1 zinc finger CCCH domain-containing protein 13 isoform X2 [Andrographis paniculata]XP_051151977.1 zinc finger CCCH domain-containing protein 13 isoform X2 [Andrographis paniculata]
MRSPLRDSPGRRDGKSRHSSQGDSPRSLGKRIERSHKRRKPMDDYSGRMSDEMDDQIRDRRQTSSETKIRIDVQLKEMHAEIKTLESHRRQLEMYLEDKIKEANTLTLRIHELEMQLSKEKEEGKRFATKIKKFTKAHNRHMRLQDELKRSHAQLQKLGEQLGLDAAGAGSVMIGNDDDSKINTASDDITGTYAVSPLTEGQISSPRRKGARALDGYDASNQVGGWTEGVKIRLDKVSRQSGNHDQLSSGKKAEVDGDAYNRHQSTYEDKSDRGLNMPTDIASADKYKVSEAGPALPSTGIAAHAMDEEIEVVEVDEKIQAVNAAALTGVEAEDSLKEQLSLFPPPPLPPIPQNAYAQYKADDETVDIDGVDEEAVEVDIV